MRVLVVEDEDKLRGQVVIDASNGQIQGK